MNIEQFLKDSLNIEKEAWATAEALENLVLRGGGHADGLIEEYSRDLTFIKEADIKLAKMINSLPKGNMRQVFVVRYLHKLTWEEVAKAVFLSLTQVHRLHKKGIEWLEANWCKLGEDNS